MSTLTRRALLRSASAAVALSTLARGAAAQGDVAPGPGARLTWYGQTASIPGTYNQLEPDPNGRWVNPATGERYSEFETPGAAAGGFVTLDLLSTEGGELVLWMNLLLAQTGRASAFIDANGLVGSKAIADYWVAPAQLEAADETETAALRIRRTPYALGGKTYSALRIQSRSAAGWSQHTYDLDSGVCLATGTTVAGASPLTRDAGDTLGRGAGSTSISWLRIAGLRHTALPGPGAHYPPSVLGLRNVRYAGTHVARTWGASPLTLPAEADFAILSGGPTYLSARLALGGMGLDRVVPPGVIGSLWIDPGTLASYGRATRIDSDPLTGVETQALGGQGADVVFALQAGAARRSFAYNARSGLLASFEFRQRNGLAEEITTMRLAHAG